MLSKKCASKKFDSFSLTKSTTEFECELRYCVALNSGLYDGFLFYVIIYSPEV